MKELVEFIDSGRFKQMVEQNKTLNSICVNNLVIMNPENMHMLKSTSENNCVRIRDIF